MVAKKGKADAAPSTEIAEIDGLSDDQLRNLTAPDQVYGLFGAENVEEVNRYIGTGFTLIDDKTKLLGIPFVVVRYAVNESTKVTRDGKPALFSTIYLITGSGEKFIINDGSTGIHAQCQEILAQRGKLSGLYVPKGLRVSTYEYNDNGTTTEASTFYFATA